MSCLSLPRRLKYNQLNWALCARIGVKVNGRTRDNDVLEYEAGERGYIVTTRGERIDGRVEPFWR